MKKSTKVSHEEIYLLKLDIVICSDDGFMVVEKPRKGEKLRKQNIQCGDGSKYMSYIKVINLT